MIVMQHVYAVAAAVLVIGSLATSEASEAVRGVTCPPGPFSGSGAARVCKLADDLRADDTTVKCETVYEYGVGQRRFCGTFAEMERAALVCRAQYDALSNRERNNFVGTNLYSHCDALIRAKDAIIYHAQSEEQERQRIEDAQRQLRALGVER